MWKGSLPPGGGPGPSLVVLLLCSLVLSGVLAYQAQDAARSHRALSESTLRDFAALASDELARQLADDLGDLAEGALRGRFDAERRRGATARVEEFAEEVREDLGPCACPDLLHDYFSLEFADGTMEVRDGSLPSSLRAWVTDTVRAHGAAEEREWLAGGMSADLAREQARGRQRNGREFPDVLTRIELPGATDRSLLYSVIRAEDGELERAYGLVLDRAEYAAATTRAILRDVPLLPPSLTRGDDDDGMLSVTVRGEGGQLLHSDGTADAATQVLDTVSTPLGRYFLQVAVRPEMADRLVIGGLPRSRLPLLVGIFLLTLGLSAIAIFQLRRQQALVRLRSGFVASVSHELRTPLAQIRLFSDLLASGRLQEEQRARSVRIIGEEAQRLAYLVENVLRFSRSEQRLETLTPERTDLGALAREIVEAFAPLAQARHARIETSLEPDAVADLDRDAVRQVLLNLLDNAVKYGPRGQTVRVGVSRDESRLLLWVDDEGPGIPPAERAAVWEPYHRLGGEAEAATGGSGIGLAVVRELVTMHGGEVAVRGAAGGGARFLAWFPAAPRGRAAAVEQPAGSAASG